MARPRRASDDLRNWLIREAGTSARFSGISLSPSERVAAVGRGRIEQIQHLAPQLRVVVTRGRHCRGTHLRRQLMDRLENRARAGADRGGGPVTLCDRAFAGGAWNERGVIPFTTTTFNLAAVSASAGTSPTASAGSVEPRLRPGRDQRRPTTSSPSLSRQERLLRHV